MTKRDKIRDFITKHPKLTQKKEIARQYMAAYPRDYKTLESCRIEIRAVTGAAGESHRNKIKNPALTKFFYNGFETWAKENLNTEPEPWKEPFVIPKSIKQLSIIADLHSVNLNTDCLQAFLRASKNKEALIINGDLMDSESLSRHIKSHNLTAYDKEIEICHNILKGLTQEFDHVYFKEGNHDFWLERYLLINAREIFKLRGLELKELLRLGELRVHHIHNLQSWQYGDLDGIHGHEFPGYGAGKFPATSLLDKWQRFKGVAEVKVIASHSHRNDYAIGKKSLSGKWGSAWVTPAMCNKMASYNPYAGCDLGWGDLSINDEGKTDVKMVVYG
jgi:hypothetical protein